MKKFVAKVMYIPHRIITWATRLILLNILWDAVVELGGVEDDNLKKWEFQAMINQQFVDRLAKIATVQDSAIAFIEQMKKDLQAMKDNAPDGTVSTAELDKLISGLEQHTNALAAAMVNNTEQAPAITDPALTQANTASAVDHGTGSDDATSAADVAEGKPAPEGKPINPNDESSDEIVKEQDKDQA